MLAPTWRTALLFSALLCLFSRTVLGHSSSGDQDVRQKHRRLMKRMDPDDGPRSFMYYYQGRLGRPSNLGALQPIDKEREFYNEVHYQGVPILDVETTAKSRAQRAVAAYNMFYAVGPTAPHSARLSVIPVRFDPEGVIVRPEEVLSHRNEAHQFASAYGEAAMLLKYGVPFPRRSSSRFGVFSKDPSWSKVKKDARRFHLDQLSRQDIPLLRTQLANDRMITTVSNGMLHGFKLNSNGEVLFKELGRVH